MNIDKYLTEQQTAKAEYDNRIKDINSYIKNITKNMANHKKRFTKEGSTNWGMVGDVGKVAQDLKNINNFFR